LVCKEFSKKTPDYISAGGTVKKIKIKDGMGGSRCGRGRTEKTATLKRLSKKGRREQGKKIIRAERGW